jgi:aspartyl-tRNA(Asn)/glutamyl-tRNA(Gln) amidotransferase subunit A
VTTVDKTRAYLERIAANAHLNAFLEVYPEEALAQAAAVDDRIRAGVAGKLAGKVIGLKDVLSHEGHKLTAGSRILQGYTAPYSATAVNRILAEDAVIIGRQNCDEFAMGSSNENSAYGPTLNAADATRVSGGSSGGSAVAVQAGLCDMSLGSDTGGSVRQPGSFTGTYGLKPTYGRISRWGLVAYGSSFDCIGPMGSSLEDIALLLGVVAGGDDYDSTSSTLPVQDYVGELAAPSAPLLVGVLRQALEATDDALHPAVSEALKAKMDGLKAAGHTVEVYDFPLLDYILPTYYILTMAEASSNLSRYDGVRYGYRAAKPENLEDMYKRTRSEGFGKEVKRRILLGNFVLSASYYDAYFTKAQRVRRLIAEANQALLQRFDVLLTPVAPGPAFQLGEKRTNPIEMFLADIFTVQANLTGQPAIAFPAGEAEGLPIGLQLMGKHFEEGALLRAARVVEGV